MTALSGLLDELMGKNRNAAPNEKTLEMHWSDEEVSDTSIKITVD